MIIPMETLGICEVQDLISRMTQKEVRENLIDQVLRLSPEQDNLWRRSATENLYNECLFPESYAIVANGTPKGTMAYERVLLFSSWEAQNNGHCRS